LQILAICLGARWDSKWRRRICRVSRMGNLFSGNMFSFDFRKTSAWDYQRRMLRPWPTSPLRSMWAAITVLLGHRSIRCGPRLRHVGHDYGETKNAAHIRTESRPTSHRNQWPTSNGITGPHRPEYARCFLSDPCCHGQPQDVRRSAASGWRAWSGSSGSQLSWVAPAFRPPVSPAG